jgi:hypothetical protein
MRIALLLERDARAVRGKRLCRVEENHPSPFTPCDLLRKTVFAGNAKKESELVGEKKQG